MGKPDAPSQPTTLQVASDPTEAQLVQASVKSPLLRSRGLTMYYHDSIHGVPQALVQDIARTHCLAEMIIIMTVRQASHRTEKLHEQAFDVDVNGQATDPNSLKSEKWIQQGAHLQKEVGQVGLTASNQDWKGRPR